MFKDPKESSRTWHRQELDIQKVVLVRIVAQFLVAYLNAGQTLTNRLHPKIENQNQFEK